MPVYPYECDQQHIRDERRSIAERDRPTTCAVCGGAMRRNWGRQARSIDIQNVLPQRLWNQWYDVHDQSPREMARDKSVERYDPNMPHKPKLPPVNLRKYLPQSQGEIQRELAAMRANLAPVEGE